jgi:two-component SAPR family response regulator
MPSQLLAFVNNSGNKPCDIAFLDIKMPGMNGLELAKRLKDYTPKINIIFVTAYAEYALEAHELYPSGYVMKMVTKEAVAREIEHLRFPLERKSQEQNNPRENARVFARTFGGFEIYSRGEPLKFAYSKTKELLAYLIDKNGAPANTAELCRVLWGNESEIENKKSYLRNLSGDLTKTLKLAGIGDIFLKRYNSFAIVPEKIECDRYGFMKGISECVNAYAGEYMTQYAWAEMSV